MAILLANSTTTFLTIGTFNAMTAILIGNVLTKALSNLVCGTFRGGGGCLTATTTTMAYPVMGAKVFLLNYLVFFVPAVTK